MKILFTCAGRRVELIQAFRNASKKLNVDLEIYATDVDVLAPALYFCDKYEVMCRIKDAKYIPSLMEICKRERIDLLIPTIDTDLLILSQNKSLFENIGTRVLISDYSKICICRDKNLTSNYFMSVGLKAPISVNSVKIYEEMLNNHMTKLPAFIKPIDGSASVNAFKVEHLFDLYAYAERIGDYVIQSFIDGDEYTVDIMCDFDGNPIFITPRERVDVRLGEVLKTKINQDEKMIEECKRLINNFKPCGPITVQLIKDSNTGENFYIEINPRFGGGAPLSMKAGADSAEALLRLLMKEKVCYQHKAAKDNAIYCRFDQSICVNESSDSQ